MKYLLFLSALLLSVSCGNSNQVRVSTGFTQGTTYTIKYKGVDRDLSYQIDSILLVFDRQLSTYIPSSYISKWNKGKATEDGPDYFNKVMERSIELNAETNGAFDITVGPLLHLWGLDGDEGHVPDSASVDSVMEFVGTDKLLLNSGRLTRSDHRVQLDVNAIAQGYAVDVLSVMLELSMATDFLVEIGGELRVKGTNANGQPWQLAIDSPQEEMGSRGSAIHLPMSIGALATSGNYRHFIEEDGKKYGHIIDPRTGYSAESDVLSASVIAPDCMTADALATAIMVGGSEFGKKMILANANLEGVIITEQNGELITWVSDGVGQ
jgi:FAD:protein FMN transferase